MLRVLCAKPMHSVALERFAKKVHVLKVNAARIRRVPTEKFAKIPDVHRAQKIQSVRSMASIATKVSVRMAASMLHRVKKVRSVSIKNVRHVRKIQRVRRGWSARVELAKKDAVMTRAVRASKSVRKAIVFSPSVPKTHRALVEKSVQKADAPIAPTMRLVLKEASAKAALAKKGVVTTKAAPTERSATPKC